jgi:hypothetical protein
MIALFTIDVKNCLRGTPRKRLAKRNRMGAKGEQMSASVAVRKFASTVQLAQQANFRT